MPIARELLVRLYVEETNSVAAIAERLGCSQGKINYWLKRHGIQKRTIADAVYRKLNPGGDPFKEKEIQGSQEAFLFGLGLGLYWGEGTKRNEGSVRLGNTDPYLIRAFLLFLRNRFDIKEHRLRFSIQVFSDMDVSLEERFWQQFLKARPAQFYKTVVTRSGSLGTYREKSRHGVLTVYFHNKKLRDVLVREIEKLRNLDYHALVPHRTLADVAQG